MSDIPKYIAIQSEAERDAAFNVGLTLKEAGLKTAAFADPSGIMEAILGLSIVTGVPIGAAAHYVGRKVEQDSIKEKELKERIKYYRNAVDSLEQTMPKAQI